jgi:RND family efflux transporter MFP subunit
MLSPRAFAGRSSRTLGLVVIGVVLLVAVVTIGTRAARSGATSIGAAAVRPALTVTTTRAERVPVAASVEASGAIAAWQEGSIAARVGGLPLVAVDVNVGDRIRKGQVLARFDNATVRAELAQAEAGLMQAEANAHQAEANHERALALKRSGALSDQDILQNTTLAATTAAQVGQAKALVAAARLKLDYTTVIAPDDGVISARTATLGLVPQAGGELFRFIRQSRLEWRAELGADQLSRVRPGLSATVRLPDGRTATGRVRQLAPSLAADTRLVLAYVDLDRAESARAGMYASGTIETATHPGTIVPAQSVVIRDGRTYVLTLDGDRARLVAVEVGPRQGKVAEIVAGLAPGDTVIVSGAGFVNDRDVVRVENASAVALR